MGKKKRQNYCTSALGWPESNLWLHQESHSLLSQTVHSVQKKIIGLCVVWSCLHKKGKKIQDLFLKAFKHQMKPPGHILNNVSAYHQAPWFTIHLRSQILHAFVQAWHFNIQDLYKRITKWDPNGFATLSERPGNVTSLCQFCHDHKETLTYPWGQVKSANCIREEWRT